MMSWGKSIDDKRGHTNRERKSCIPIVDISIPSIMMRPLIGSTYGRLRDSPTWIKSTHKSENAHGQRRFSTSYPKEVKHQINVQIQIKNEPVRPSRPTRSPAFKVNDTSCSTAGRSGAYLMLRFSTTRRELFLAFDGQYAGTR
jgi:hypothetical protein